jgi:hypothetical protein
MGWLRGFLLWCCVFLMRSARGDERRKHSSLYASIATTLPKVVHRPTRISPAIAGTIAKPAAAVASKLLLVLQLLFYAEAAVSFRTEGLGWSRLWRKVMGDSEHEAEGGSSMTYWANGLLAAQSKALLLFGVLTTVVPNVMKDGFRVRVELSSSAVKTKVGKLCCRTGVKERVCLGKVARDDFQWIPGVSAERAERRNGNVLFKWNWGGWNVINVTIRNAPLVKSDSFGAAE